MKIAKTLTAVAAAALTTAAMAAVTFDVATGTGFVGKGDVQTAFGWNNQQLQTNANMVEFLYDATTRYSITCIWVTGEGTRGEKEHEITQKKTSRVNSTVAFDTRKNNQEQVTGFNLMGYGSVMSPVPDPVVGGSCLGYGAEGTISAVSELSSVGGLMVRYGGTSVPLY